MANNIKIDVSSASKIVSKLGLGSGGRTQLFFTNELKRVSDPYVPFKQGALKNNARIVDEGTAIEYNTPYARYHWYGKLMVGPKPKTLTNSDMNYRGAPMRGPKWVERAFTSNMEAIIKAVERSMK